MFEILIPIKPESKPSNYTVVKICIKVTLFEFITYTNSDYLKYPRYLKDDVENLYL